MKSKTIDNYTYIMNGQVISKEKIDLENINTTLIYDQNSNKVFVFDANSKVKTWATSENTEFSISVLNSLIKLETLQDYILKNKVEEYYNKTGKTPKEYNSFFNNLFGTSGKSTINILHDSPDASINGGNLWTPVSYPKLSAVNFNDKTSALTIAVSAMWLCNNNFYGGSKAYFGALAQTYQNIAFNNCASSVIKL